VSAFSCCFWFVFCLFAGALDLASRVQRIRCAFLFVAVLHRMEPKTNQRLLTGNPNKSLAKSPICRRTGCFFLAFGAIEVMGRKRWRSGWLELAHRVRAHRGGHRGGGAGACNSGRRPADTAMPLHLLAEGRPFPIPPGDVAIWEAALLLVGSHGVKLWRPRRPKWRCPRRRRGESGGEVVDPIAFQISARGPSYKSPGTCLYFSVSLGSFCKLCCSPVI
jgi:hypothetical protein